MGSCQASVTIASASSSTPVTSRTTAAAVRTPFERRDARATRRERCSGIASDVRKPRANGASVESNVALVSASTASPFAAHLGGGTWGAAIPHVPIA